MGSYILDFLAYGCIIRRLRGTNKQLYLVTFPFKIEFKFALVWFISNHGIFAWGSSCWQWRKVCRERGRMDGGINGWIYSSSTGIHLLAQAHCTWGGNYVSWSHVIKHSSLLSPYSLLGTGWTLIPSYSLKSSDRNCHIQCYRVEKP